VPPPLRLRLCRQRVHETFGSICARSPANVPFPPNWADSDGYPERRLRGVRQESRSQVEKERPREEG
jgi:hypothetical protein